MNTFISRYVTSGELCETLGIHRSTLFRYRRLGYLPPGEKFSNSYVWVRAEVEQTIKILKSKRADWAAYQGNQWVTHDK